MIGFHVDGLSIELRTKKFQARFHGADLYELIDSDEHSLIDHVPGNGPAPIELTFMGDETHSIGNGQDCQITVKQLSPFLVHIYLDDPEGDVIVRLSLDDESRLHVEPSASCLRMGLAAVRWNLAGISPDCKLVAPLYQGCRQSLDHPLIANESFSWPSVWEAPLAVLEGNGSGFYVYNDDCGYRPKNLLVGHEKDPHCLRFETQALGPWMPNQSVGGQSWVLDCFKGSWEDGASAYKEWVWRTSDAENLQSKRPDWVNDIRLALQWCENDTAILDAVAKTIDPKKVLLHIPHWRRDAYDTNYPDYTPGEEGIAFISYAQKKGFHVMPHFNYFAADPAHPLFPQFQPYILSSITSGRLMGWRYDQKNNRFPPLPQTAGALCRFPDEKTMAYIHPGLSLWRRTLTANISTAVNQLDLSALFVDQTLCVFNVNNAIVENMTMAEGLLSLLNDLAELAGPPAIGGEGRNELNMRYQSFAQTHLFNSHHGNCKYFEELDPVPIGDYLFGELCRSMAYGNNSGKDDASKLRLETHEKLNALPSLAISEINQILKPNPAFKQVLDRALA